jgi:hypothetical protein
MDGTSTTARPVQAPIQVENREISEIGEGKNREISEIREIGKV